MGTAMKAVDSCSRNVCCCFAAWYWTENFQGIISKLSQLSKIYVMKEAIHNFIESCE